MKKEAKTFFPEEDPRIGERYGTFTVKQQAWDDDLCMAYLCKCDCGGERIVKERHLKALSRCRDCVLKKSNDWVCRKHPKKKRVTSIRGFIKSNFSK